VLASDGTPGKFEALDGIVADIVSVPGRKVIVWSNYVGTIEALTKRYAAYGSAALYGGTPVEERQKIAAKFQTGSGIRVLIANPAAAGTGFTLTAASFTIYETLSWRYDFYAQSQDRNHRIGQTLPVTYFRLIAADTIEEAIAQALERKTGMAADLLGDDKAPAAIAALTKDEMVALLQNNRLPD
jgi:SNF2 family DNA or RNA helicase